MLSLVLASVSAMVAANNHPHTLILYDGVCALCNWMVKFLLRRDRRNKFYFAPLQSDVARAVLKRHGLDCEKLDTVCLTSDYGEASERVMTKSAGVLYAATRLGGVWRLSAVGLVVPRALRDAVYDLIARHRYRWFGNYKTCPLPEPRYRDKFLAL